MDRLLTDTRMARRLRVARAWLVEQAVQQRVPHLKAGKRYLFCPEAVEAALAAQAATPPQGEPVARSTEGETADA